VIENEHPRFPLNDWQYEVGNGDTHLGYEAWLASKLEEEDYDTTTVAGTAGEEAAEPTDQALAVVASYLSNNGLNDDAAQAMCFQESTDEMMLEEILDLGYVPTRDELMVALAAHREFFKEREPLTNEAYVARPACPACRSEGLNWMDKISYQGDFIEQAVKCQTCGASHKAIYNLTAYEKE
jgi:hypothetical protein